jgi:hypothetical protein
MQCELPWFADAVTAVCGVHVGRASNLCDVASSVL